MKDFLLQDYNNCIIPLTRVVAENRIEALIKSIKGILEEELLSVDDICESLEIKLTEIPTKIYE